MFKKASQKEVSIDLTRIPFLFCSASFKNRTWTPTFQNPQNFHSDRHWLCGLTAHAPCIDLYKHKVTLQILSNKTEAVVMQRKYCAHVGHRLAKLVRRALKLPGERNINPLHSYQIDGVLARDAQSPEGDYRSAGERLKSITKEFLPLQLVSQFHWGAT